MANPKEPLAVIDVRFHVGVQLAAAVYSGFNAKKNGVSLTLDTAGVIVGLKGSRILVPFANITWIGLEP